MCNFNAQQISLLNSKNFDCGIFYRLPKSSEILLKFSIIKKKNEFEIIRKIIFLIQQYSLSNTLSPEVLRQLSSITPGKNYQHFAKRMWKFYRIKFFSSQRPRRAGALALSQSEAGAQSGLRGNVAAAAKHFTFSWRFAPSRRVLCR